MSPLRVLLLILVACALMTSLAPARATCVPTCAVPSSTSAFAPPVTLLDSGDTLTWSSVDRAHTATEQGASSPCFNAQFGPSTASATFRVFNGQLLAKQPVLAEKACSTAQALPDGSFAVRYFCLYHTQMMGTLVVRPGA